MFRQLQFFALAGLAALGSCDGSVRREGPAPELLQIVRIDAGSNRRWVLTQDALAVYDNLNRRRLRRIELPDWPLAGPMHACPPDMVLDSSGALIVSSNVVPVLWRVDPRRFEVTRIPLSLETDADKDVGFTALSFGADGALMAQGATFASLWRIDLAGARATRVASPPSGSSRCGGNV